MKFFKPVSLIALMITAAVVMQAQEKSPVHYGKISPADFTLPGASYDPGAEAVVIADIGHSEFITNTKGWFSIQFKHFKRIKILKKEGFAAGTVGIPLYVSGNTMESVQSLKAVTYNLINGKVEETKLEDKSVFTDKIDEHTIQKKFTFPALREGSIIEYSYTQYSDFLSNLQPWEFQGEYPCLWSEYEVDIPKFFQYVTLSRGFLPFQTSSSEARNTEFRVRIPGGAHGDGTVVVKDDVIDRRWVMKDVPALKEEAFTTTVDNYISKVEFQLARYAFPDEMPEDVMGNWVTLSQLLMKSEQFGADLTSNNGWLSDDMKEITKEARTPREKAQKIYAYVRDHFTCTAHTGLWSHSSLKTVFKNKNGTEAEINLLLTAMLNHEHIVASPVILSTRSHGFTHEVYPLLTRFNYVICQATIDGTSLLLDASEPWLGFGRLPSRCYNGHARAIMKDMALPIRLDADSLLENRSSIVTITNVKAGEMAGSVRTKLGYFESCRAREIMHDKGETEFFKSIKTGYTGEMEAVNVMVDTPNIREDQLSMVVDFDFKPEAGKDLIYFNPMMTEAYKENPFSAGNRYYPVEMPYAMDETLTLYIDVPEGYEVDELPKSAKVLFNDNEGFFEYLIGKSGDVVQFRSRIKLLKANFKQEDYATLRDFFAFVVKKHGEQIVFKKKK